MWSIRVYILKWRADICIYLTNDLLCAELLSHYLPVPLAFYSNCRLWSGKKWKLKTANLFWEPGRNFKNASVCNPAQQFISLLSATWESEIRRVMVQGQSDQKLARLPPQLIKWAWWSMSVIPAMWETMGWRVSLRLVLGKNARPYL
jgi:hypothetical protein